MTGCRPRLPARKSPGCSIPGESQIVYGPEGNKLAVMSGQALTKAFVGLPGGDAAVYKSGMSLTYYRHSDWLGSSRLASLPTGTNRLFYDGAYAPYGESYAETGTADHVFAGMRQNVFSSGAYPLYDALMREYNPIWGRWLKPDPAGLAAADPANPQTWNRYAYVVNNPLAFTDPMGLYLSYEGGCWYSTVFAYVDGQYQGSQTDILGCTDALGRLESVTEDPGGLAY